MRAPARACAQAVLDYEALQLRPFYAGAAVRLGTQWHRVADPLRHPVDGLLSLANPVGSPVDKALVGLVRWGAGGAGQVGRPADVWMCARAVNAAAAQLRQG